MHISDVCVQLTLLLFVLLQFVKAFVSVYCILYKNTKTWQVLTQVCISCAKPVAVAGVITHGFAYLPFPHPVSDFIHVWSPFGRGYAVGSVNGFALVDTLKYGLGNHFDYRQIIDKQGVVQAENTFGTVTS